VAQTGRRAPHTSTHLHLILCCNVLHLCRGVRQNNLLMKTAALSDVTSHETSLNNHDSCEPPLLSLQLQKVILIMWRTFWQWLSCSGILHMQSIFSFPFPAQWGARQVRHRSTTGPQLCFSTPEEAFHMVWAFVVLRGVHHHRMAFV
jgi:hypothetical protein